MSTFRPLVLVTEPFFRDPKGWQRYTPAVNNLVPLLRQTRHMLQVGVPVTFEESGDTELRRFSCREHSLKLQRAYRSNDGRILMSVLLDGCSLSDEDSINEPMSYYFLSRPEESLLLTCLAISGPAEA